MKPLTPLRLTLAYAIPPLPFLGALFDPVAHFSPLCRCLLLSLLLKSNLILKRPP
jgi:hypothetical protein